MVTRADGLEIAGVADTLASGRALIGPGIDVLLIDLALPDGNGAFILACRSINFLAAHDGFTLADTVSYTRRHNQANSEDNRDGHGENYSWNCGVEGPSDDPVVVSQRSADLRALLATLFASTGTIMLTAGDEFGRSQGGNNNAYCQDNPIGWIDWTGRDRLLEAFVAGLAKARKRRRAVRNSFPEPGRWHDATGAQLTPQQWENADSDGFIYRPESVADSGILTVSRSSKQVGWHKV